MKYNLIVISYDINHKGRTSQIIEFPSDSARKEFIRQNNSYSSNGSIITYSFENEKHTVNDVFLELLKTNPLAEPKDLMDRAKEAHQLMSSNYR